MSKSLEELLNHACILMLCGMVSSSSNMSQVLAGQMGSRIPPVCPGSASGAPLSRMCPKRPEIIRVLLLILWAQTPCPINLFCLFLSTCTISVHQFTALSKCKMCTAFIFGFQTLTLILPSRIHQAQHNREW